MNSRVTFGPTTGNDPPSLVLADSTMSSERALRPRAELHHRVLLAFAREPEIHSIYVFGAEVEGEIDEYSDIDLVICSADLATSQQKYANILDSISTVIGTYYIVCGENELAQMVMFENYSPYQKIDFTITDTIESKQIFAPFKCLYRSKQPILSSQTSLQFSGQRETLRNWLNDVLFSIPRFTKCLFRRDRDMYRRWVGTVENLAVMLYESYFGWSRKHCYRLRPDEHKALDKTLTSEHRARLDAIQPLDHNPNLAISYQNATEFMIELYKAKASAMGEPLNLAFAERMRQFLAKEISRFIKAAPTARR